MYNHSMTMGCFTDRHHQPTPDEIQLTLGSRHPLWERLIQFIATNYRIEGEWSFWGPAKSSWNLWYRRKGKALIALYPQKDRIMARAVLGKAQAERALSLKLGGRQARC
jgi:hypothetical protein